MSSLCMARKKDGEPCPFRAMYLIEDASLPRTVCGKHALYRPDDYARQLDTDGLWPEALDKCSEIYAARAKAALHTSGHWAGQAVQDATRAEDFRHLAMDRRVEWGSE